MLGPACLVPGSEGEGIQAEIGRAQDISIPSFTYAVDRNLQAGVDLAVPQIDGAHLKAGPNFKQVTKLELATDAAWATMLDENRAADALQSCQVKLSCVERLTRQNYRVVGTTIVARGLNYKMFNSQNQALSLDVAVGTGALANTLGAGSGVSGSADATVKSAEPRVVGVRLMPVDLFQGRTTCMSPVLFSASGRSVVTVTGGGGRGSIGAYAKDEAPLGRQASLQRTGSETSECDDNFERRRSDASAVAKVEAVGEGALRFTYTVAAGGGHYVTTAGCLAGHVVGKTGHDTSATATADMTGVVAVMVRSEGTPVLRVSYANLPTGTTVRVVDWRNEPLHPAGVQGPGGTGPVIVQSQEQSETRFQTRGPGIYRVETTFQLDVSVGGNVGNRKTATGDVKVSVE
ncbi:hypothetical protein [Methylobacterium sp. PvR107]|uniref:hypothetical protein n=1 Tax=Methylobacterium sp. PvR107 TaxID=2806597 RepID=UPI001AE6A0A7|nr:hypothetical protein [Methylobacterium sp. PvR107]MBP1184203.1 hypothetical protein [Methylobacterium sp. PvR107]